MKTLELTTPQDNHLERNAQPTLEAIATAARELQNACAAFTAGNDNRSAIERQVERLQGLSEELSEVTGEDLVVRAASLAHHDFNGRCGYHLRTLANWVPRLYSEEEGTRMPLKKIGRAMTELRAQLRLLGERNDNRGTLAKSLDEIKTRVNDVVTVDENVDPWIANNITAACDAFLRLLKEPIRTEPDVIPIATRERVPLRAKLSDELDDLILRLSGMGDRTHGGYEEAKPLVAKARAMRQEMFDKAFEPIDDPEPYAAQLRELQDDLYGLNRLQSEATGSSGFMEKYTAYPSKQITVILSLLEPVRQNEQEPKTSILTTIGRAFAWSN